MKEDMKGLEVIRLLFCEQPGLRFPVFWSGVAPRMTCRCLKVWDLTFEPCSVSLHLHWKAFSDLHMGRGPDEFRIFIQLFLPRLVVKCDGTLASRVMPKFLAMFCVAL